MGRCELTPKCGSAQPPFHSLTSNLAGICKDNESTIEWKHIIDSSRFGADALIILSPWPNISTVYGQPGKCDLKFFCISIY